MPDKRNIVIELESLMNQIAKESNCQFKKLLSQLEANITPSQYFILKVINLSSDCKAADIAHMLDISPAATTNILDKLYNQGLIERTRSEKDRRVVWLKLTDAGRKLIACINAKKIDLLMGQFANVTENELILVKKVFEKLLVK